MARDITIFELHFDDARFGPTFGDETGEADGVDVEEATADSSGGSRTLRVASFLVVLALGFVVGRRLVRRFRSDGGEQVTFDDVEAAAADDPSTAG